MTLPCIGVVGTGALGSSLAQAFARAGYSLVLCNREHATAEALGRALDARVALSAQDVAAQCDVLLLCVKPADMHAVCLSVARYEGLAISVAAGVEIASLQRWMCNARIVRAMPNTPVRVGAGMTALSFPPGLNAPDQQCAHALFAAVGEVVEVEEAQMHAVTALSGSGPAFAIAYAEAMIAAGTAQGLEPSLARTLVLSTLSGTAAWVRAQSVANATSLEALRNSVTSKGGTTAAGLAVMAEKGFDSLISETVLAAVERSRQLADAFR